ncbi:Transglutaminase-like superfamily protein [Anatilimnocola aggregata]|uniref:Transglutaminase-like superfamily protein n=1 Tax=Anatilimnocola aggregata TaxID=2528021 RepID=A0A517YJ71_9BACT|nr:transglutaminase-like domain-containing protein [Anatilimnocola aggregata]QDU30255.1 Transglutaminase-like superfamily protein [Anatilimnocola aggregata]
MRSEALRSSTWALAFLATLALEFARAEYEETSLLRWSITGATFAVCVLAGRFLRHDRAMSPGLGVLAACLLVVLAGLPPVYEWVSRRFFDVGESPELVQLVALRNVMLGLAAISFVPGTSRLSCAVSVFVALGALMFLGSWPGQLVLLLYGFVGMWWLLGANWERMQGHLPIASHRDFPLAASSGSVLLVVLLAVAAAALAGNSPIGSQLTGYFWGAGGNGHSDLFASRGIGNGEQLVAATQQASTFGAVESELFLDSEKPSLYDVFNDLYGDEIKRLDEVERTIALSQDVLPPQHQHATEEQQAGRTFAAVRRRRAKSEQRASAGSANSALILVEGRVPLHLRLETFASFDGRNWSHAENRIASDAISLSIVSRQEKPWVMLSQSSAESDSVNLCNPEHHVLKVIRLATNRVPTPAHLTAAHIDFVDEAGFYGWTKDDVLCLSQRTSIPSLQVIHLESRSFDIEKLTAVPFGPEPESSQRDDEIAELARMWTNGVPAGRHQIEAIVAKLNGPEFKLDPEFTAPADCQNVAAHFLFESQRGPDYLYATSAVLMLRSLGYQARLATGLYARPERYDRVRRQTPVLPNDAHVWAEVRVGSGWLTIEPTPGYTVLPPLRTWSEHATLLFSKIAIWVWNRPLLSLLIAILSVTAARLRREIIDFVLWLFWQLRCWWSPAHQVFATLWLLELRGRLAGMPRPSSTTISMWYPAIAKGISGEAFEASEQLCSRLERYLYSAAAGQHAANSPSDLETCRLVLQHLSLGAFSCARRNHFPSLNGLA